MPRILLVDDDRDVRVIMEHVLIDAGHQVDPAATMASGRERLRFGSHDLVLAHAKLPDGTGMELCDHAAEFGIKCIIITGYAFTLPAGTGERYDILLKPMRPTELIAAVEQALRGQ